MTSNSQIDAFLTEPGRLNNLAYLGAMSYDDLLTASGLAKPNAKVLSFAPSHIGWGAIVNMDPSYKMGSHWAALALVSGDEPMLFYYDPLLANKEYPIPGPVKALIERIVEAGGSYISNLDADQFRTIDGQENVMCGAYSALALMGIDKDARKDNPAKAFLELHDRLRKGENVLPTFEKIRQIAA